MSQYVRRRSARDRLGRRSGDTFIPALSLFCIALLIPACHADSGAQAKLGLVTRAAPAQDSGSTRDVEAALAPWSLHGTELRSLGSHDHDQDLQRLTELTNEEYDPVIAVGDAMAPALARVARNYPKTRFILVDGVAESPSVDSIVISDAQAAYLAGALAALGSPAHTIVAVDGLTRRRRAAFESGFRSGALDVTPGATMKILALDPGDDARAVGHAVSGYAPDVVVLAAGSERANEVLPSLRPGTGILAYGASVPAAFASVPSGEALAATIGLTEALAQKLPSGITTVGLSEGLAPVLNPKARHRLSPPAVARFERISQAVRSGDLGPAPMAALSASTHRIELAQSRKGAR